MPATRKVVLVNEQQQYEALELFKRGYKIGQQLGQGSYAKVVSAFSDVIQKHVAIKIVSLSDAPDDFVTKFFPREIAILSQMDHPNIVAFHEKFTLSMPNPVKSHPEYNAYVVMELAGHGDLLEYIKLRTRLTEGRAKFFFRQLVAAVEYLHQQYIIHRDLKCENLLLDVHNNIKITDFGFARIMKPDEESETYCGSAAYAAPEVLKGEPYTGLSYDIWSLGIILFIMVCGRMPFDDSDIEELYNLQCASTYSYPHSVRKSLTSEYKTLVEGILQPEVKNRMTIFGIQTSNWLANVPYQVVQSIDEFRALTDQYETIADGLESGSSSGSMTSVHTVHKDHKGEHTEADENLPRQKKKFNHHHHKHRDRQKSQTRKGGHGMKAGIMSLYERIRGSSNTNKAKDKTESGTHDDHHQRHHHHHHHSTRSTEPQTHLKRKSKNRHSAPGTFNTRRNKHLESPNSKKKITEVNN